MHSVKIEPKLNNSNIQKVGLIALATDFMIEKDFLSITKNLNIDLFVNRIHCYHPLTTENLIKMSEDTTNVADDILPNEKLDCVVYGCTSGTIAAGYQSIKEKINKAKPEAMVITPSTAAINALKKNNITKLSLFTPYCKSLNEDVAKYFIKEGFTITSNAYFDIDTDTDIAKVDPEYLYETMLNMNLDEAEALFISCTNLPALNIIKRLEDKLNKIVLSSNQVLIWDTLRTLGRKDKIQGYGKLFLEK